MSEDQDIKSALDEAASSGKFGESAWLTFYLSAQSSKLKTLVRDLIPLGACNVDGADGGFVYAKIPTELRSDEIKSVFKKVRALAEQHGVDILLIDLDSATDASSTFFSVYREE